MRFTISTSFLVLFLALFSLALATKMMDSDNIQDELTRKYLIRRDDDATKGHGRASASSSAEASVATNVVTTTTNGPDASGHGKGSAETAAATETETTKKKKPSVFASPEILQTGTLFYVGISVTTLLWMTGKAIDVQTNRQERYAESLVHSI